MASPAISPTRPSSRAHARPAARAPLTGAPDERRPGPEPDLGPERITGRYRYDGRTRGWWWSPEMFTVHGLPATSTPPAIDDYLRYQHTEDRPRVREAFSRACVEGRAFALETRIVRADGRARAVVLVGEPQRDQTGAVAAIEGMCVDITESRPHGPDGDRTRALEAEVDQMRAAMASRAMIEQAKGILMLLTGCGDQVAFDLLAHISSHTHRKVRDIAEVITHSASGSMRLPDDVRAIIRDACPPSQPLR
jgi:hypothetical protein